MKPTLALIVTGLLFAQPAPTVRSGAYTEAQATAGEAAYNADCASCHGAALEGTTGQTPPLVGNEFLSGWRSLEIADLFDKIQETMPAGKPGTLPRGRNAQILAYILKKNNFPAGSTPLPSDTGGLKKLEWGK